MWACNFGRLENANKYYSFCMQDYDDSYDFDIDYNDTINNIQMELSKMWFCEEDWRLDRNNKHIARDYIEFATRVKHWQTWKYVREYDTLYIDVYIEHWYHEGARMDWTYSHDLQDITAKARKRVNRINKKLDKIGRENTMQLQCIAKFSNGEAIYAKAK